MSQRTVPGPWFRSLAACTLALLLLPGCHVNRRDYHELLERVAVLEKQLEEERDESHALRRDLERRERGAEEEENEEIREVRRRLQVMRHAVDAFIEVDKHDRAHRVEMAMHSRELAIEGRRDEEAQRIRAVAPDRAELAELLHVAAEMHEEWDHPDRAELLYDLSRTYAEQWRQRQGRGERREYDLEERGDRLEIVHMGIEAYQEAGYETAAGVLGRFHQVGVLQREGASDDQIAEAAEGLTMGQAIEYLQGASRFYDEWGSGDRAELCDALAEYYAARQREGARDGVR